MELRKCIVGVILLMILIVAVSTFVKSNMGETTKAIDEMTWSNLSE